MEQICRDGDFKIRRTLQWNAGLFRLYARRGMNGGKAFDGSCPSTVSCERESVPFNLFVPKQAGHPCL
jgi:hypothetical protein